MARRSKRTKPKVEKILKELAKGRPIVRVLEEVNIGRRTYYEWLEEDADLKAKHDEAVATGDEVLDAEARERMREWSRDGVVTKVKTVTMPDRKTGEMVKIVTEELTVKPDAITRMLAMRAAGRLVGKQMASGEAGATASLLTMLEDVHGGGK